VPRAYRRQLINVAHQKNLGVGRNGREEGVREREVQHGGLVHDQGVTLQVEREVTGRKTGPLRVKNPDMGASSTTRASRCWVEVSKRVKDRASFSDDSLSASDGNMRLRLESS
jgi:hypothetical protein